ncbi:methyl-accepting chemotaxis protein [Synechococcus sp. PCC 6716]|nr:methyl-accepting chemotaxis protein [Synechococcus sp. PCC 6716]
MRIRYQLYALIGFIASTALIGLGLEFYISQQSRQAYLISNEAHRVRESGQRVLNLRLTASDIEMINKETSINDERINALINGDPRMGIPAARDPKLRDLMLKVQSAWPELKEQIQGPFIDVTQLAENSEGFFKLVDEAVKQTEASVAAVERNGRIIQAVIFCLEMILIISVAIVIQRVIKSLLQISTQVVTSSNETAAALAEQEKVIAQQAASVNQTTTTMEELGASSRQSAEQAEASAAGAKQAMELATYGKDTVHHTVEGIDTLKGNVMAIAEKIMQLSEQTTQVTAISELVADIANQTNILALNAAVEAARAGEHGKGFSVVAQEVRKLADQSKKSAEKITTLIREVQAAMNGTVMVTDEGMKATNECAKLAHSTSETFATIANAIDAVHLNSQQIALSSKQQAVGVQQAISAMNAINLGAQETSTSVSQIKTATQQLVEAAETLQNLL